MAVGDLNRDGVPDVVVANASNNSGNCPDGSVSVLLGNSDGSFGTPLVYSSGGSAVFAVAVADVNADGHLDIIVANSYRTSDCTNNSSVGVLLGKGDGTFQQAATYNSGVPGIWGSGPYIYSIAVGDVNSDGIPDLVLDTGTILFGNGDGTFRSPIYWGSHGNFVSIDDLNGDTKPDLVVTNYGDCSTGTCTHGSVSILLGNGDGTFQPFGTYDAGDSVTHSVSVADVNGDTKLDLLLANNSDGTRDGTVGVLLGNGDGTFRPVVLYDAGAPYTDAVAVADVDGDGKPDVLAANYCSIATNCSSGTVLGAVGLLLGNGDGTFSAPQNYNSGAYATYSVIASDINGDSRADAIVLNACDTTCNSGVVSVLLNQSNSKWNTSTTILSSPNPTTFGQTVTFSAVVTPQNSGTPTGTVTFSDTTTGLGTSHLSSGSAMLATSGLSAGSHSITASYSGDSNFNASSSSPLIQSVSRAATAIALTANPNSAYVNQPVALTAMVSSQYGGLTTGSVTFKQGATELATVSIVNGQATFSRSFTVAGSYPITAVYSGDANNFGSLSTVLKETVNPLIGTTTKVLTSGNPSFIQEMVTFTAIISAAKGSIPDGEVVTFSAGTTPIGTAVTSSGKATFSTSMLAAKTQTIHGSYPGDTAHKPSSGAVQQIVMLYPATMSLSSNTNPSQYGQPVILSATVASSAPGGPTGTVTFKNGTVSLGTAPLNAGTASLMTSKLPAGDLTLTAKYSGDSETAHTSATTSQTVGQATTTVSLASSQNPSTLGELVKFSATVTSPTTTPIGSITWMDGTTVLGSTNLSSGKGSFSTSALGIGSHGITAVYNGTANIAGSTSSVLLQTVH